MSSGRWARRAWSDARGSSSPSWSPSPPAALALGAVGALSHLAPIAVAFAGFGAGYASSRVALKSLVQRRTPGAVLSRVLGVVEGLELAGMAAGSLAVAVLARLLDVRAAIAVVGLGVAIALVARWGGLAKVDAAAVAPDPALVALVVANPLFAGLPPPTVERLLASMEPFAAEPATVLVRQGDHGDRYYMISDGAVSVTIDGVAARQLGPGDGFGEIALVRDVPRTATTTAITPVRGFSVGREDFLAALAGQGLALARDHAQRLLDEDRWRGDGRQSG